MNIEFIKSELEKLTAMIATWNDGEAVAPIERDIALDKIKDIYNALRFDSQSATPTPIVAAPIAEPERESESNEVEEEGNDVEVEFIFAEEDLELPESEEEAEEEAEPEAATQSFVAVETDTKEESTPESEPQTSQSEINQTPTPTNEPQQPTAEPAAPKVEQPARSMDSLFGSDEIRRQPRTKHQRMMSIYDDAPSRHEKAVDISKIFDMDIDDTPAAPTLQPTQQPTVQTASRPTTAFKTNQAPEPAKEEEKPMILGDAIAANSHTLADTIAAPAALAEEITHSKINSLQDAIGINDKFLMIRDLFDGDSDAYNQAIAELDSFETFDDCMIHIVENYAWNPESEGAKFMMQLLERKLV